MSQPGIVGGGYNVVFKNSDMYGHTGGYRDFQGLISREIKNVGLIAKNTNIEKQVASTA